MATDAASSRKLTKAYLYLMALVCIALVGGIVYISHPKFRENEALSAKRSEQPATAAKIIRIWKELSPSVKKYHDDVKAGLIERRDESLLSDVPRSLRDILTEMELAEEAYLFGTPQTATGSRGSTGDFESTSISIDLRGVPIDTFNLFLNKLRAKFGKVASIYSIDKLEPKGVKDSQISQGVTDEVLYDTKITLQWYTSKTATPEAGTTGRQRRTTSP